MKRWDLGATGQAVGREHSVRRVELWGERSGQSNDWHLQPLRPA